MAKITVEMWVDPRFYIVVLVLIGVAGWLWYTSSIFLPAALLIVLSPLTIMGSMVVLVDWITRLQKRV